MALALPLAARVLPNAADLPPPAQGALGVFGMAVVLWVTAAVPLAVTGLAILAALPLLGVLPAEQAFALFGNSAVFFILGAFVLAAAMMVTGLSRRVSLFFLVRFGGSARRLAAGILVTSALLSCLMPIHATAAILFPTLSTIVNALRLQPRKSPLAILLLLSMAWGCCVGGTATLLGGARTPLALGILQEATGWTFGFADWLLAALPVSVCLAAVAMGLLNLLYPPEVNDVSAARHALEAEVREVGPMGLREKKVAAVAVATIGAWIFLGHILGMAAIALLSGFALFAANAVEWSEIESGVNWGVLLMYGGAIALGTALTETGATPWIARHLFAGLPHSPLLFLAVAALATFLLTEFISNAAAVAVLLPIALSAGEAFGVAPAVTTLTVGFLSGLAFTLPVGSPPNAIAFSSGYYEVRDVLGAGAAMTLASFLVFLLAARFYWPLLPFPG